MCRYLCTAELSESVDQAPAERKAVRLVTPPRHGICRYRKGGELVCQRCCCHREGGRRFQQRQRCRRSCCKQQQQRRPPCCKGWCCEEGEFYTCAGSCTIWQHCTSFVPPVNLGLHMGRLRRRILVYQSLTESAPSQAVHACCS